MVRKHLLFKGRVQGVGFRYTLYQRAHLMALTGWVRNCSDGSVEACLQGDYVKIQSVVDYMYSIPYIRIEDCEIENLEVLSNEKSFEVKY